MRSDIKVLTRGRWPSILMQLGFPADALSKRDVPCPMCGGKDRFKFLDTDGNGTYYCRGCGGRDGRGGGDWGLPLVMKWKNLNWRGACEAVEALVEGAAITRPTERQGEDQARSAMKWMWESAKPLGGSDPASFYLFGRAIAEMPSGAAIRFAESMPDYDAVEKRKTYRPAMLARMVNSERGILHITFLTIEGKKAEIAKVKRFFTGARVPVGGAVRLAPAAETMGVSTGIETSLSAAQKHGMPVWATLSDVGLLKFEPPPICRHLTIFGDCDTLFSGQMSSYSLGNILARRAHLTVKVAMPPDGFKDWNDVIQTERDAKNVVRMA
jgi:putative DNA primase/helicase